MATDRPKVGDVTFYCIELRTAQWHRMLSWYRDVLGLRTLLRVEEDGYALLSGTVSQGGSTALDDSKSWGEDKSSSERTSLSGSKSRRPSRTGTEPAKVTEPAGQQASDSPDSPDKEPSLSAGAESDNRPGEAYPASARIALMARPEALPASQRWSLVFETADLDALRQRLLEFGSEADEPVLHPEGFRQMRTLDPDCNRILLVEWEDAVSP
jgi:predicted enzyme related to lactoylglutathione lyase